MSENEVGHDSVQALVRGRKQSGIPIARSSSHIAVKSRLAGAVLRAMLVVLLIAMPTLLLAGANSDSSQIVMLVAIFGAALTIFEYASHYPGLVEFRDAPPFNRMRFVSLFVTVSLLTAVCRDQVAATTLTNFVTAIGSLIGSAIDFPLSPVRLVVQMMPEGTSLENMMLVRTAAGISYLISLLTLAIFLIILSIRGWPSRERVFNVWVNLPMFDPSAGGDVVQRLRRDGRFNVLLGFAMPFLTPLIVMLAASLFDPIALESPLTLVWTLAAWGFLPTSLFMRGIAMARVATMIEEKRKQSDA